MKNTKLFFTSIAFIMALLLLNGCTEYNEPDKIYDPNVQTGTESPVIESISPSGEAIAGVRVITINGKNFAAGDTTWIFIGDNQSPVIKSFSDTKIEIYRPPTSGNSLDIKVVNPSARTFAKESNYRIENPMDSIASFLLGSGIPDWFAMEIDKNGTYWVCSPRRLTKITPDGLFFTIFKDNNLGFPTSFNTFTDLKFGPGGYLFATINRADIYRINSVDSTIRPGIYATISGNITKIDFAQNGNLYAAGSELYIVRPLTDSTGAAEATGHYSGKTVVEVRVANNHLYVADATNIWRNIINSDGSLGPDELLVNLQNTSGLETCTITSFNIDSDEKVYLALANHSRYALFALEDDGAVEPFYVDNITPLNIKQLIWGYNNRYLYLSRARLITSGMRVYRIGMERPGAVNNGREF